MESSSQRTLVLVSGSGRSGTSSLAGSLKRLGLHVPQPEVQPSPNNPRGYYEPEWVIDFHKGYLKQLALHNIDSRPSAVDMVAEVAATGEPKRRLVEWLATQPAEPQLVVKDPHALWFADVWAEACDELDIDLRWLTALRHPAEVVGSRDIAYLQHQPDELRLVKETSNIAGWVHAALLAERAGRGRRRSFVRYVDLIADWRQALLPVQEQLALDFNADLSSGSPHEIDDFIEASMRRSQLDWSDIRVPTPLQEMAEEVWQLLCGLIEQPHDQAAIDRLDELHERYRAMYAEAAALTFDHRQGEIKLASRQARQKQKRTIRQLRTTVDRQAEQLAALEDSPLGRARRGGAALKRAAGRLRRRA